MIFYNVMPRTLLDMSTHPRQVIFRDRNISVILNFSQMNDLALEDSQHKGQ